MADTAIKQSSEDIVHALGKEAKSAAFIMAQTPTDKINAALKTLARALRENVASLLEANKKDLASATQRGLTAAMIDRLKLDEKRIESMAQGVETVIDLDDPTGKILWSTIRPNGMKIERIAVPIGVLGMIYESRPNVTVDASILCLKSHNAVILRGGSESLHSSLALHDLIQTALEQSGLPKAAVSMIPVSDREAVGAMLRASEYIDVMIPRGGRGLIERVMNEARMPVFGHLEGLCHIYVHPAAKPEIARNVTLNAKMRRTGVCGAMETLLLDKNLDKNVAKQILAQMIDAGCEIVGDKESQALDPRIGKATEDDWRTEYLDAKLSCRMVDGVQAAVEHINFYGSHHTDSILTENQESADYFLKNVDSGIVLHNASTQFADGGEFGMGAEIGIATGKMHARGPVGLEQLCTYKYLVRGTGQTRP
ncbi:MAG: glutamate-5-semialdehyde dehydrogenase [Alphaproteobacteria bacterium]|nr:glutamate-5-semialdehyde dehydrogenase [Alphaproteobacteria bacterium]MBP7757649.1 glutamate-5-semialdehyde dehydrogenase [Alphaproteobacteria bacterium]MBP7761151.1 glutamate-5-semialdehyde dehydrogenase [Alphaproteobacteria bacterium]MBP7905166.1 glutamate-5-semialdehyde dehydrogenase [Alphaproteobacteria bacterium]